MFRSQGLARKAYCVLAFALLAALFVAVNLRAYRGCFQSDELENIGWTGLVPKLQYLKVALSPFFQVNNFRPVGLFYFRETSLHFGLDFWKYVAVIQALHLLNAGFIWLLARKLGAPPLAASAGAMLFAFHMALFDAFWKPVGVLDLTCGTFCILCILLYAHGRWVLSFVAFWLAYKSKELAVMLPCVLAAYEVIVGERNWKRLVPFFLVSLSFGLQGLLLNPNHDNDYTFRFTWAALTRTVPFYADKVFLLPYLCLLLPVGVLAARNRRAWFGLATMLLLFFPLLFLPGRLIGVYCYVPFIGLAIAFSGIAPIGKWIPAAVFLLLFAPLDAHMLAVQRRETIYQDNAARRWLGAIERFALAHPDIDGVVYDGLPTGYRHYGCTGALQFIYHNHGLPVLSAEDPKAQDLLSQPNIAVLTWLDRPQYLDIDLTQHARSHP